MYGDREVNNRPHKVPESVVDKSGKGTLAECFNNEEIKKFSDHQPIDQGEFSGMLDAIYSDLNDINNSPIIGFDPARGSYDTPFWTGNPDNGPAKYPDNVVCIGDKCSNQSAVNYVAQGMWSAAAGESSEQANKWVSRWNNIRHGHDPMPDEYYWTQYGYVYYRSKKEDKSK